MSMATRFHKHRCPRRAELGQKAGTSTDSWTKRKDKRHTCSYCGSLEPGEFLQAIRESCTVEPTDKTYKAYVTGLPVWTKFYYQHLSEEQQLEFIALYNDKTLQVGYPGYFYTLPFFMAVR